MFIYYVYAYLKKSDGQPYYIGKGKGKRYQEYHPGISVPKDKSQIVFLETNLSNVGACALERRYIEWYGRKDLGTGPLLNRTLGGEGNTSRRSLQWRLNHSKTMTGRTHSKATRKKLKSIDRSYMKTPEYKEKMRLAKLGTKIKLIDGERRYVSG
jgi:hypothetical protein